MNLVVLSGYIGKDPEVRFTESGKAVANVSLATDEGKDKTEWHKIVAWDKTAEILGKHFRKGSFLQVFGRLQTRSWEKNGEKRYATEVVASRVEFGPKVTGGQSQGGDDDLPF